MTFKPSDYFDLSEFPFKDIFDGTENIWEVLPKIHAYTSGKMIMGESCHVSDSAHIREGVILGNNVTIGHAVELKNCIILNGAAVAHLSYIGDGIVGNQVNIAGGAMLANFRLDKQHVRVKAESGSIDTGLEKFSAVIGDDASVGANSVINPGTILGKRCLVYPLTSVTGVYNDGTTVR